MKEALKFLTTGVINTTVDFGILNILIAIFGISQGDPKYIYFKALSYVIASVNSFALNKWWVFKNNSEAEKKEIGSFALVSTAGLLLNTTISLVVFHAGALLFPDIGAHLMANIGALSGTALVLLFNFFSYKFLVFKKQT